MLICWMSHTLPKEHPEHLLYVQRAQTRAERKAALEEERKKRKEAKGGGKRNILGTSSE